MLTIKNYVKPQTLQEAYDLNQNRSNLIIAGMLWSKMQSRSIDTAIDLSDLNLNQIEEFDDEIHIGAMVTLRQLEQSEILHQYTDNAIKESVKNIVGVQFRNLATIGGSLFGRYGFSDVLTMFMALDCEVELFNGGRVDIEKFASMPPNRDILVKVIIKKTPIQVSYMSQRNTRTDFPVLTCAMSVINHEYRCVIGARPLKAVCYCDENQLLKDGLTDESIKAFADDIASKLVLGSNLRGSSEYRRRLSKVLIKRCLLKIKGEYDYGN